MLNTLKLDVDRLEIGMYVAKLDRPWLETPFLFQGFHIRDEDELEELKKHCQHVYIYVEEPDASPSDRSRRARFTDLHAGPRRYWLGRFRRKSGLLPWFRRDRKEVREEKSPPVEREEVPEDTTEFQEEIRTARGVHDEAVRTVQEVMSNLRLSGTLDMQRLETAVTPMVDSILRNPAALECLIRLQNKGDYLYHHSLASLVWATVLGRHIGLDRDDLNIVALGALLLDVGKIRLPDSLLQKPGKLNETEMRLAKRHVELGVETLKNSESVDEGVIDMVAHHHERFDGSGYPNGLKGHNIPVFARIGGIVDAYDAMISTRPYANAMSSYEAFRELRSLADVEFQVEMIDQFTQAIGVFPTGTLVELNTGEIAVVTRQNRARRLRPEIMIIMDPSKQLLDSYSLVDLNETLHNNREQHESLYIERGVASDSFGIDPAEFFLD